MSGPRNGDVGNHSQVLGGLSATGSDRG